MSEKEWKLGDPNKSYTYVLPMLGLSIKQFYEVSFPKANFLNAFIGDDSKGLRDNCVLLLYKFSGKLDYIDFENKLREHPEFQASYEPDKRHTMYVFTVPVKYQEEYNKVIEGKYSHLSEEYKSHILQFHNIDAASSVYEVLYKKEPAFIRLEQKYSIKIDRNQEAAGLLVWDRECFQEKYKVKESLDRSAEFGNIRDNTLNDNLVDNDDNN